MEVCVFPANTNKCERDRGDVGLCVCVRQAEGNGNNDLVREGVGGVIIMCGEYDYEYMCGGE